MSQNDDDPTSSGKSRKRGRKSKAKAETAATEMINVGDYLKCFEI